MSAPVSQREFARLEGCNEKQVRRGVASGKLIVDAQGMLDPAQVDSGWRRPRINTADAPVAEAADTGADSHANVRTAADTVAGVPVVRSVEDSRYKTAVAHKADFDGRLREMEYRQKAGELIELSVARQVVFDEFRSARDAWLNFPTRFAPLLAADLGIEDASRLADALTTYIHKQLAQLGDPRGEFRKAGK